MTKLLVVSVFVLVPLTASAQTASSTPDPPGARQDRLQGLLDVGDVMGMDVRNELDKTVGVVENLLIDPNTGWVSHVVVRSGGVLGIGGKLVVVPWNELKVAIAGEGKKPVAKMVEAKLETAPPYDRLADRERPPSASPGAR